jgi:5-methylcytosine-specific restriction endonuclease McrA
MGEEEGVRAREVRRYRDRGMCTVAGCGKPEHARYLCITHYMAARKARIAQTTCPILGCERVSSRANGWCSAHYQRWLKYGDPLKGGPMRRPRGTGMPLAYYKERRRAKAPPTREGLEYAAILRRDPCAYCGGEAGEVDHIVPVEQGGMSDWDNLTAACRGCNQRKRTKSLLEFLGARLAS